GQLVETNLLQSLECRADNRVPFLRREDEPLPLDAGPARPKSEVNVSGMLVECKDGRWLMHSSIAPHFFKAWVSVIGFEWIWQDERFRGAPQAFPDAATKAELVSLIRQRMREKTAAEWMELYSANKDVCAEAVQTTQEALTHPQMVEGGHLIEVED